MTNIAIREPNCMTAYCDHTGSKLCENNGVSVRIKVTIKKSIDPELLENELIDSCYEMGCCDMWQLQYDGKPVPFDGWNIDDEDSKFMYKVLR